MDFEISNHGSIILFRPLTAPAREFIDEHVQSEGWQWFGGALAVEPRYAGNLAQGILDEGLTL